MGKTSEPGLLYTFGPSAFLVKTIWPLQEMN